MTFKWKDGEHYIWFRYVHKPDNSGKRTYSCIPISSPHGPVRGVTECHIGQRVDGEWVEKYTGYSFCILADAFCKDVGRKVSLTRSLRYAPATYRKAAWEGYLNRPRGG